MCFRRRLVARGCKSEHSLEYVFRLSHTGSFSISFRLLPIVQTLKIWPAHARVAVVSSGIRSINLIGYLPSSSTSPGMLNRMAFHCTVQPIARFVGFIRCIVVGWDCSSTFRALLSSIELYCMCYCLLWINNRRSTQSQQYQKAKAEFRACQSAQPPEFDINAVGHFNPGTHEF